MYNNHLMRKMFCSFPFAHNLKTRRRDGGSESRREKKATERFTSPRVELRTGADNNRAKGPVAQFGSISQAGGVRAASRRDPLSHTGWGTSTGKWLMRWPHNAANSTRLVPLTLHSSFHMAYFLQSLSSQSTSSFKHGVPGTLSHVENHRYTNCTSHYLLYWTHVSNYKPLDRCSKRLCHRSMSRTYCYRHVVGRS